MAKNKYQIYLPTYLPTCLPGSIVVFAENKFVVVDSIYIYSVIQQFNVRKNGSMEGTCVKTVAKFHPFVAFESIWNNLQLYMSYGTDPKVAVSFQKQIPIVDAYSTKS
jgi:hypothetical protein